MASRAADDEGDERGELDGARGSAFDRLAGRASDAAGRPWAFGTALAVLVLWAISGPLFGFNDTWQLVINTGTTIVTFLMVFLIQSSQNRDTAAIQIKLDEIIRSLPDADTRLLDLEELGQVEIRKKREQYEQLAEDAREQMGASAPNRSASGVRP